MTTCQICSEENFTSEVRHPDGTVELWCCDCWNKQVADRRAARKAELAQRPKCEACRKRVGTWNVGAGQSVLLCGWCKKRAEQTITNNMSKGPAFLGMFGPQITGAGVLAVLEES